MKHLFSSMFSVALAALAFADTDWPLVSLRIRDNLDVPKAQIASFMETLGKHRGAFDDIWFCSGQKYSDSSVAEADAEAARVNLLPLCQRAGIDFSVQQGITLGHGPLSTWPLPASRPVKDDSWTVDREGKTLVGVFCPRSDDALSFVYDTVKATVSKTRPRVYWLDDDLRLGVSKPEGCFCDRCMKAFNAKFKVNFSREELAARLFDTKILHEPLRRQWIDFNAESLAVYAASARKAVDDLGGETKLAYQAVWSDAIYTGRDFKPLLDALSVRGKYPAAIRPGAGWYREGENGAYGMVAKCLSVAREAERCRDYGKMVGSVSYENETYPRRFLSKSPSVQVAECALAMASGCDAVSVYGFCGEDYADTNEFDRLYRRFADARLYFTRMREEVRRTRLGGVARYVGSHAAEMADFDLRDEADQILAQMGVPVTCAEAKQGAYYITKKSVAESDADEIAAVRAKGAYEFDLEGGFRWTPSAAKRNEILDKLDSLVPGGMPVRLVQSRTVRVLPRIDGKGRTSSVTLFNMSLGDTDELELRIRHPACAKDGVRGMSPDRLTTDFTVKEHGDELVVSIRNIPAGGICTFFFNGFEFQWRGFMLDEARHFFGKEAVKKVLDRMAALGLNRFHWHLTDDQGWRLDIPGMPELVKYGAKRLSSPIRGADGGSDGKEYGPFYYTAADVKEIVEYAAKRGIVVVPEIELPGHTRALLAAHPEFACEGVSVDRNAWCEYGVCKEVICAGDDEVIRYYERIFDEVMKMFPGEYIHIGGDECPKDQWKKCPKCQARIKAEKLKDEEALQGWITRHMVEYISKKGRRAIGWDEILEGGDLPKGTIIQSWRGVKGGKIAAEKGYDVIMSPCDDLYFSIPESVDSPYPVRRWVREAKKTLPASRVRAFDPLAGIPSECASRILGAECCAWSEEIHSPEELRYKCHDRLGAFSEALRARPR